MMESLVRSKYVEIFSGWKKNTFKFLETNCKLANKYF